MDALVHAYRVAVELQQSFGEEAAHVASEWAEEYRQRGDKEQACHWSRVTAFATQLTQYTTIH